MSSAPLELALRFYRAGDPTKGYLILKQECHMTLKEAKEALQAAAQEVDKGDGETVQQERALKEVMDAVDTFDDMTLMMLRHMRETKQPIATEKPSAADTLQLCAAIYDAMRHLIAHDVNPTRAMTIFVTQCCENARSKDTGTLPSDFRASSLLTLDACEKSMVEATTNSLKGDLLTLL
jgi:hypothetical protein